MGASIGLAVPADNPPASESVNLVSHGGHGGGTEVHGGRATAISNRDYRGTEKRKHGEKMITSLRFDLPLRVSASLREALLMPFSRDLRPPRILCM
jgi:phage replication-related protein YjqB (UPF0714/DUF867 family)